MIYVSSACLKRDSVIEAVEVLLKNGFKNIELSGGKKYDSDIEAELLRLKKAHSLNFLCHNYFPPPNEDFILNLASLDKVIANKSLAHVRNAIEVSKRMGCKKYAFHAGFLIDFSLNEIGKVIKKRELFDRQEAKEEFIRNYNFILSNCHGVDIYLENNVISEANFRNHDNVNPFFITEVSGYEDFRKHINIRLLLDTGHLKVSCNTLGLDFKEQLSLLMAETDYIHVSDNYGREDSNMPLTKDSHLYELLRAGGISGKTITLEVYSGMDDIKDTYKLINDLY